jgi:hypothetical protein
MGQIFAREVVASSAQSLWILPATEDNRGVALVENALRSGRRLPSAP